MKVLVYQDSYETAKIYVDDKGQMVSATCYGKKVKREVKSGRG